VLREVFSSKTVNVNEQRDKEYTCYRILVGKLPLGRSRRRLKVSIDMNFRKIGCADRNWILLTRALVLAALAF
jgi:hypothetical protein